MIMKDDKKTDLDINILEGFSVEKKEIGHCLVVEFDGIKSAELIYSNEYMLKIDVLVLNVALDDTLIK